MMCKMKNSRGQIFCCTLFEQHMCLCCSFMKMELFKPVHTVYASFLNPFLSCSLYLHTCTWSLPATLRHSECKRNCLLVGCLTSQQQASVSQGRICSDNFTCCHTEIEVADPTFYLTQSQYTDTGPTSPSADSITPGAWQGSHWSANF